MENEDYISINQRPIIELLIEGEIFQYMSGSYIQGLGKKFGIFNVDGSISRWIMLQTIFNQLHARGKTERFLKYFFFEMNINSAVKEVIRDNEFNQPKYDEIAEITEESQGNNRAVAKFLRQELLERVNIELAISDKKLIAVNNEIKIVDYDSEPEIIASTTEIIDNEYINDLLEKSMKSLIEEDFDSVVTKSRTLIESVFIQILHENNVSFKENGNISQYRTSVNKALNMRPDNNWNKDVSNMITGLNRIIDSISNMRNNNSDAHGSSNRVRINSSEAELILNTAVNVSKYYLEVNARKKLRRKVV
ncbi:abortive infection family protein [Ligilactobacillus acidipiscis]|uniref:abortive infection family protein n=1 Tax=Ligilactobacillus acidipiscis TaxID=89059 RepID=UPI0022E6D57B|nr:abortive infection family protein [Ligilactobacillus acidipiscis]